MLTCLGQACPIDEPVFGRKLQHAVIPELGAIRPCGLGNNARRPDGGVVRALDHQVAVVSLRACVRAAGNERKCERSELLVK